MEGENKFQPKSDKEQERELDEYLKKIEEEKEAEKNKTRGQRMQEKQEKARLRKIWKKS